MFRSNSARHLSGSVSESIVDVNMFKVPTLKYQTINNILGTKCPQDRKREGQKHRFYPGRRYNLNAMENNYQARLAYGDCFKISLGDRQAPPQCLWSQNCRREVFGDHTLWRQECSWPVDKVHRQCEFISSKSIIASLACRRSKQEVHQNE